MADSKKFTSKLFFNNDNYLIHGVPVKTLDIFGRKSHGDDPVIDVRKVKVESTLHMATLVLADDGFQGAGHGANWGGRVGIGGGGDV